MATYVLHFNDSPHQTYPLWGAGGALGKWRKDFETFAGELGAELIRVYAYEWAEEPDGELNSRMDGILGGLKRNDIVIVHWVFLIRNRRWIRWFIDRVKFFGAKLVYMISDIESWRFEHVFGPELSRDHWNQEYLYYEAEFLSEGDGLIVHSKPMEEKLFQQFEFTGYSFSGPVVYLGPSGYRTLYYGPRRTFSKSVDYAGSLNKAQFLKDLPNDYQLTVFGVEEEALQQFRNKQVKNIDRVDAEAIPHLLKSAFGLVWDSETYPAVTGWFGEYLRYTTPAKFHLYLAANQPVIVWSQSAQAEFVKNNGIGLIIDDLSQISEKLDQLTESEYDEMVTNVERLSPLIRNGTFVKKAILDMEVRLFDRNVGNLCP